MSQLPEWITHLTEEDLSFVKSFVLSSGSLKTMAQLYQVSYPTMRLRLDRLIEKITIVEDEEDYYISLIKSLAIDDKYDIETARTLIEEYKKHKENGND